MEWEKVWRTIASARWNYLLATLAIVVISYYLRALRWRILLNAEASLSVSAVFWANMAGYLGNNFLPARAGELVRTFLISSRSNLSKTYVLTTALTERLMDAIALILVSSIILRGMKETPAWMADLSGIMMAGAGAGAIIVMFLPHASGLIDRILGRAPMPARLRDSVLRLADQILLGLKAFHDARRFGGFVFLTAAVWLVDAAGTLTGAAALGIGMSLPVALLLLAALGLSSALPSTPGYIGVYQFAAVTVLMPFGISRDSAVAYILVAQAVAYTVVLAFGLPGLFQFRGLGVRASEG